MSKFALTNARILTEDGFRTGLAVLVENGRVAALLADADLPGDVQRHDLNGGCLVPGFIDLQVNGGGGVLFNNDTSVEAIASIGRAHRTFGTTGFLPTLISDDAEVMARAIEATHAAIAARVPGVLGIHIEGPFLSEQRKGVHDASKFRTLDEAALERIFMGAGFARNRITIARVAITPSITGLLAQAVR